MTSPVYFLSIRVLAILVTAFLIVGLVIGQNLARLGAIEGADHTEIFQGVDNARGLGISDAHT